MAQEIRNSEIKVLYGETAYIDGLDGPPRPKLIEEVQDAQRRVKIFAAQIHDRSPEAIARRRPGVLSRLEEIKTDFGLEHPFYLKRLKDAQNGGYLPKPAPFREISDRFQTMQDIKKTIAV